MCDRILEYETKVFIDTNSVKLNMTVPKTTLKKKHNSIQHKFVKELVTTGSVFIYKVDTRCNMAYLLFTKLLGKIK